MTNEEKLALYKSLRREYLEGKLCKVGLEAFPEEYEEHMESLLEHLREIYDESYIDYASSQFDEEAWRFELELYLE